MALASKTLSNLSIPPRIKNELRDYVLLALYLYVCFGAIVLYKVAILGAVGVSYLPFGLPVLKALVLAKFIMIGRAVRLGDRLDGLRIVYVVACKALIYIVFIVILTAIEEFVMVILHGRGVASSLSEVEGHKFLQTFATGLIMLLILIPYVAFLELNAVLGEGKLWHLLLSRRARQLSNKPAVSP